MVKRKKVIWSDKASQDLLEILDFYNQRNGKIRFPRDRVGFLFTAAPSSAVNKNDCPFPLLKPLGKL